MLMREPTMDTVTHRALLKALLQVTKPSQARSLLRAIGDNASVRINQPFGTPGYRWCFYGENDSNMSTINLGSKPGRSLVERITNAVDAVLEKEMDARGGDEPESPMEAAGRWFGRPPTGVDSGLFSWLDYSAYEYDRLVHVVMSPADEETGPTIDVVDDGIGVLPEDFVDTILSLHSGNKITKRYLIGAFGQGGSATLAFCDYALIVSRYVHSPEIVGFTIVKLLNLGESYKEDAYVYLAVEQDGRLVVPSCRWDGPIEVYPGTATHSKVKYFHTGTLVRHYGYRLKGAEKRLGPTPGNLYHMLQHMTFDPLLPFHIVDLRQDPPEDKVIVGSRNRLMQYVALAAPKRRAGGVGTELRHYAPREMVSPLSEAEPTVGIEYWVIFDSNRVGGTVSLRARSNALFVDPYHPIVGTLNGQNQGELTARVIADLQLAMLSRHLVVHIDATQASKRVRSALFASTREGFKQDEALDEVIRVLVNRLKEDEVLYQIERELVEKLLRKETATVDQEVKQEIAALLSTAGFRMKGPRPEAVLTSSKRGPHARPAPPPSSAASSTPPASLSSPLPSSPDPYPYPAPAPASAHLMGGLDAGEAPTAWGGPPGAMAPLSPQYTAELGQVILAGQQGGLMPSPAVPPDGPSRPPARSPGRARTLPYPHVTRFEIVFPKGKLSVRVRDNEIVKIATDADHRFDREARITIHMEPDKLEVAAKSVLRQGRMYWRLRPTEEAFPGDEGEIIATLTRPDGSSLTATLPYEVLPPPLEKVRETKGYVPPFSVMPVDPYKEPHLFRQIWPDANQDNYRQLAYKAVEASGEIIVYYSTVFTAYRQQLEQVKKRTALANLFRRNYEIWIGYHALLQYLQQPEISEMATIDQEALERIQERERALVAEMQARHAVKTAQIQRESLTSQPDED